MNNKTNKVKWTTKFKAVIISLSLAFVVAIGGAGAAIGLSLSDNNVKRLDSVSTGIAVADQSSAWNTAVSGNGTFTMTSDWTATENNTTFLNTFGTGTYFKDGALYIPAGKTVTINLNGKTLNRGQKVDKDNGCVIYNEGTLTIKGTGTITGGYNTLDGGGIYNAGTLTIQGGTIKDNKTAKSGGGIYSAPESTLTISGGTIGAANSATVTNGNTAAVSGGGVCGNNGTFTISGGTFIGNTAGSSGGGVSFNSNKKVTISGGTFGGTNSDSAINGNTSSSGGGIYISPNGAGSSISGVSVLGNTSNINGGGICVSSGSQKITISGVTVKNNTAASYGGGIAIYRNNAEISGNSVSNENQARYGAGVWFESATTIVNTLTVGNTEISNNVMYAPSNDTCRGAGVYISSGSVDFNAGTKINGNHPKSGMTNTGIYGGGMFITGSATVTLNGTAMEDNYSVGHGGAIYSGSTATTIKIKEGSEFKWNWCEDGFGGVFYGSAKIEITGGTFYKNGYKNRTNTIPTRQAGVAYFTSCPSVTITKATFEGNVASTFAGAIFCNAPITIGTEGGNDNDIVFKNNYSQSQGGAIQVWSNTTTINSGTFEGNSAANYGGVAYLSNGATLNVNGGTYKNNGIANATAGVALATRQGGVFYGGFNSTTGQKSTININSGTFTGNKVSDVGGAVMSCANANIKGGTFTGNQALRGSVLFGYSGSLNAISGGTMSGNTSGGTVSGGGAVFTEANTTLTISGGQIKDNTTTLATAPIEKSAGVTANGTLSMSGNPVISGNTRDSANANLYSYNIINITGAITSGFNVGTINKGVLTNGFNSVGGKSDATLFKTDLSGYKVAYQSGEIIVVTSATDPSKVLVTPTKNSNTLTYSGSRQTIVSSFDSTTMNIVSVKLKRYTTTSTSAFETTQTTLSNTTNAVGYSISGKNITATEAGQYEIEISAKTSGASWVKEDGSTETGNRTLTVTIGKKTLDYDYSYRSYTFDGTSKLDYMKGLTPSVTTGQFLNILSGWTYKYFSGGTSADKEVSAAEATATNSTFMRFAGSTWYLRMIPTYKSDAVAYNYYVPTHDRNLQIYTNQAAMLTVTVSNADSIIYNGSAQKPNFTISYGGTTMYTYNGSTGTITTNNATLHGSLTFTVSYSDNTRPGTATIAINITAATNFSVPSVKNASFTIQPMSLDGGNIVGNPTITLTKTYDGTTTVAATKGDLQIQNVPGVTVIGVVANYDNANVGTNKTITLRIVLDGADKDLWDGKLTYKGTITAKTLSSDTATVGAITAPTYNGAAQTPTPTVTDTARGVALVKDTDYTVSYTNNINAGTNTATITFTGKGNYAGNTLTKTFTINPKNIATDGTVAAVADVTYTGAAFTPTPAVTNTAKNSDQTSTTLVKDTDYTISYSNSNGGAGNSTNAGTVTITITGAGNYTGTMTKTFVINKATIADDDITFAPATNGIVGQAYSAVGFTNASTAAISLSGVDNGTKKTVEGTFAWKTPNAKITNTEEDFPDTCTITATAVFTPTNASIAAYEKEITFTATQLKITVTEYDLNKTAVNTEKIAVDYGTGFAKNIEMVAEGGSTVAKTGFSYTINGEAKTNQVYFTGPNGYAAVAGTMYDQSTGTIGGTGAVDVASVTQNYTVYVSYVAGEVTYEVYHVQQRVDGTYLSESFILGGGADGVETEERTGMTASTVNPQTQIPLKTYEGFAIDKTKTVKSVVISGAGDTKVFVYYARNTYKVTFSASGATNVEKARTLRYGALIEEPEKIPVKTACTFLYWSASKDGEEFDFTATTVSGAMTLYAVFEATEYKIIFDFNVGAGDNQIPSNNQQTVDIGGEILGGVVIWDVDALFDGFNWQQVEDEDYMYEITYSVNNLTSNKRISGIIPSAVGYTFVGWFEDIDNENANATEVIRVPNGTTAEEITLTAKWARTQYSVRLDAQNGEKVTTKSVKNLTAWEDILPAKAPTKTGNKFVNWYVTNDPTDKEHHITVYGISRTDGFCIADFVDAGLTSASKGYTVTLYAEWTPLPVTIKVADNNKGTLSFVKNDAHLDDDAKVYVGDVLTVEIEEDPGYKFKNLVFTLQDGTQQSVRDYVYTFTVTTDLVNVVTEDDNTEYFISIDAVYTERRFTIKYELDGGRSADSVFSKSFSPSELLETSSNRAKLPSLITKNGYDFDGWIYSSTEDDEFPAYAHERFVNGEYYGEELYLVKPASYDFRNITLKATWKPQEATVYLYNASYSSPEYNYDSTGKYYSIVQDEAGEAIVTGSKINIISPERDSFMFLGWATTRNGAVVYPAVEYDSNDKAADILYEVNADHDTDGNPLNRNNLYAVWHVKDVNYIVMTATNNNCTYGGDGIKMSAKPAQDYTNNDANITLTYHWYRVFSGMYDNCFTVTDYVDKDGYKWYLDASGNIVTYEKEGKYYDTNKQEVSEPTGTKFTIKDFNTASIGTACEEKFKVPNVSPNSVPEVTVKNVANCGTYICVVDVVATEGSGQTTREKGYGEIEISMSKASYGNLKLETVETEYNTEAQYGKVKLDFLKSEENATLPQDADDGFLTLPDGSKAIVTYTYYKGAGELVDGVTREQITDLSQIKNVGSYHVVVSFAWAVGGDKGNYFDLTSLEADLVIGERTIKSVTPQFVKDGEEYEAEVEFTGTYDGSSYGVEFVINDKVTVNNTSKPITELDDIAIDVKVYLKTENGDVEVLPENLPTKAAGTYAVVIQGLKGEAAGNYILKSDIETRQEYTIGKKKLEVADHIHFNDDDKPVYDGKSHTISISFDTGYSLPEYIKATYSSVYEPEDSGHTTTKLNNGGTDAGIYAVTVKFSFMDSDEGIAAANNYEKLADMTATLTINKADFFDFHNADGKDVLRDSGFVSASYGFQTGKQHHPYVKDNFGCDSSDVSVTYAYYSVNTANQTRTCLTGTDEDGNALYYTNSQLVAMGNALVAEGKRGYISAAGKYEIIAHVNYESAAYRNNFADIEESKTTITYDIEDKAIESVSVVAWADGFEMKAKLGEAFNYEWIKQINIVYEDDAGTLEITRPEDIELAGIDFGKKGGADQNNFWHVGTFEVYVSYYGKPSAVSYEFNVVEEVTEVTLKYRVGTEGEYKAVPESGLVLLTEGVYNFEISYTGTNTEGNTESLVKYATVSGTPKLGENVLNVADAGNYEFGDIKVALYAVLTDVSWEYSLDGENWAAIPEGGELVYAGKAYGIRVVKDGMTFAAHTDDGSDILNVNSYITVVGRSGNYLIEEDNLIIVTKKPLSFDWNSNSFEYDMLSHVPTMTGSGVEEADKDKVTFVYNYTDASGNDILSTDSIVAVGTYHVHVSMVNSAAAGNYTLEGAENAEYTFGIVQAEIKVKEVYYSEGNYGKNTSYKGNEQLRLSAMKIDFGEHATVAGTFRFVKTVNGEDVEIDGTDYKNSLKSNGAITVKFVFIPNNMNYKDLTCSVTITVEEPKIKTGVGALSVELGPDAIDFYMLEDKIDTHDIHVYQLYDSSYQENGQWYGAREEVPNPIFRIEGYSGTLESYRVNKQDVSSGKIVLIARSTGSNSGRIELLVIDEAPTGIEIVNEGEFRTRYYVGETPEFRDIEFRLLFGGNKKPVSGLKVPSIKANFTRELTANDDKFTVTFKYANVDIDYEFEALPKENLEIVMPTTKVLTYTGGKLAVPELTFKVDVDFDGQAEVVGQNDLEGVTVKVYKYLNGSLSDLQAEGEYTIRYEFTVTNPRFNAPDPKVIQVTVTTNPFRVTIKLPEGTLSTKYTGKAIDIPVPTVSEVVDTRYEDLPVNAEIVYTISDGKNTPVVTEIPTGAAWKKTNAGTYTVTVQVNVEGKEIDSAEYTYVIEKATNSSITMTVSPYVKLGEGANFKFPVTADFGADTVKYEYSKDNKTWRSEAPDEAGRWYVRATIAGTDNYTSATSGTAKQFEVRAGETSAAVGEGYVEGSIEGGDGVGAGWSLEIRQMKNEDISGVSISKQNVLEGYNVSLKNESGTTVQPESAYTVRIKLSDALQGKKDLNVYFVDADGKSTKMNAKVEGEYIAIKMSDFDGRVIITSAQPKESVGLMVTTIVLGVVAAGAIAACVVVFILKKKKRGAQ